MHENSHGALEIQGSSNLEHALEICGGLVFKGGLRFLMRYWISTTPWIFQWGRLFTTEKAVKWIYEILCIPDTHKIRIFFVSYLVS